MRIFSKKEFLLGIIVLFIFCGLIFLSFNAGKNVNNLTIKKDIDLSLYLYSFSGRDYQVGLSDKQQPKFPKVKFASANSAIEFSLNKINEETIEQKKNDDKSIVYNNIWPGISLRYSTFSKGIKEEIIIDSYSAWENYSANHEPFFEFTTKPNNSRLKEVEIDKNIYYYFVDAQTDQYRFKFEKPFMVDANRKHSDAVTLKLKDKSENYLFLLIPDQKFLKQAKFPVVIDPTISVEDLYDDTTKIDTANSSNYTVTAGQLKMNIISPWYNSGGYYWDYRIPVTYDNSGGEAKTDYDILVVVDTQTLISAGKMQSDCDDIRFTDTDGTTLVNYWIESGCNTSSTQIWVRIPDIAASTSETYYMYYGNSSATAGQQSWTGQLASMFGTSVPSGWTSFAELNDSGRFIRGNSVYGGTGGSATHTHSVSGTTGGSVINSQFYYNASDTAANLTNNHTHTFSGTSSSASSIPPYVQTVFGYRSNFPDVLPANTILLFTVNSNSLPSGWTSIAAFNDENRYATGSATYGTTGGNTTHTHSWSFTTSSTTPGTNSQRIIGGTRADPYCSNGNSHTHTISGNLDAIAADPPYLNMPFGTNTSATTIPANSVFIFRTAIPPLGWTRFSALDGKFPRGANTYGGTNANNHTHTTTPNNTSSTGGAVTSNLTWRSTDTTAINWPLSDSFGHYHTGGGQITSGQASDVPPYFDVLFATRNSTAVTTTLGSEVSAVKNSYIRSINLLAGEIQSNGVSSIDSFVYNLSEKPSGTEAKVQFSQDGTHWYNSSGALNNWDTLTTGVNNTINLASLGWSGKSFYYKIWFSGDGGNTPVWTISNLIIRISSRQQIAPWKNQEEIISSL